MRGERIKRKMHKPPLIKVSKREGDRKINTKTSLAVIEAENKRKNICLNCTKPKCNGVCEIFKN